MLQYYIVVRCSNLLMVLTQFGLSIHLFNFSAGVVSGQDCLQVLYGNPEPDP